MIQIIPQTFDERYEMYLKHSKEELARMMASAAVITNPEGCVERQNIDNNVESQIYVISNNNQDKPIIKIINKSDNKLPTYETPQAAGMDIRCSITEPITLQPLERHLFPTGLFIQLPEGYEAQIRPRSGLAYKRGLTVLNTPGTIDADYRGEIGVILINLSNEPQTIEPSERIAQMVINHLGEQAIFEVVDTLDNSERGEGGFGHTGTK